MSSVPLCLLLPRKAAGFILPSPLAMAACFSDQGGWCRGLPFAHPRRLHYSLVWRAFWGLFFGEVFVTGEGKTCSFSCSRGNCSDSFGSSPYKAKELLFVGIAAGESDPPFNPSIQGLYV